MITWLTNRIFTKLVKHPGIYNDNGSGFGDGTGYAFGDGDGVGFGYTMNYCCAHGCRHVHNGVGNEQGSGNGFGEGCGSGFDVRNHLLYCVDMREYGCGRIDDMVYE